MMDSKFNYYQFYTALSNWLSRYPRLITVLRWTNRAVVVTMYVAYLLILAGGGCGQSRWSACAR